MEKYDLIIVGAGPAGIFTAVELLRHGSKKKMLLVEKGKPVEKRHCPKAEVGHCVNCRPTCAITTGFSGAGAFSDGKLSLSYEVGGDLPTLIGEEFAQELIDYTDKIYLEFGADPHVEGVSDPDKIRIIRRRAIRHLEKGRVVIFACGTGNPFFSTDTAVALRAIEMQVDAILMAKNIDGVYTADPHKDPNATLIKDITYQEALQKGLKVMDAAAFALCAENHVPMVRVFGLDVPENLISVLEGSDMGTFVHP